MERHRKLSDENQHDDDRIMSSEYFSAEGNMNRFPSQNELVTNAQFKGKNLESQIPFLLSEDLRISKILRRLAGENNPSVAIDLCKKLESAAKNPANLLYIRRSLDFLSEIIISILRKGPAECLNDVANIYGIFGYIARLDFPIYKNWIFKNYDTHNDIRVYLMRALKVTLHEDANNRELGVYSNRLFVQLKEYLEGSEAVDEFIAVSDCIAEFSNNYQTFEKHFTDIVDIIVGWHLESDQSAILKNHCSTVLQNFSQFFVRKLDFTLGLLRQFLEDITVFGDDIEKSADGQPEVTVGSFIGAMNTVIKCLVNKREVLAFKLGQRFFNEAVPIITRVGKLSLSQTTSPETVQSINEFFILIIQHGEILITYNPNDIFDLIKIQETNISQFDDTQISSLLFLILTIIRKLQTATSLKLVEFITNRKVNGFFRLKFSKNPKIYKLLLKIYHEILMIKNVPLLQEIYKNILEDIKVHKKVIFNSRECIYKNQNHQQAECVINFYLSALSILATQTSSIIGMYALQPSLLELLLKELEAANVNFWLISPSLYSSMLNFLIVHCKKNNNYLASSNLLVGSNMFSKMSLDDISPTSENFTYILKFHSDFLTNVILFPEIPPAVCIVILNWLNSILIQCWEQADILNENVYRESIGLKLCQLSMKTASVELNLNIAKSLTILITKHSNIAEEVFDKMHKVCCTHMCSTNSIIRNEFSKIFAELPLSITLTTSCIEAVKLSNQKIPTMRQWLNSSTANIRDKHFKLFIEQITFKLETIFLDKNLPDFFTKSCSATNKKNSMEIYKYAMNHLSMLVYWIQSEAAKYCVNNKLRTSLGKPQDTFLKIEALIKEYARVLTQNDHSKIKDIELILVNQKHARLLLGFLEFLEKSIYNACEGSAFSMSTPEKAAKLFFRLNTSTCNEWFKRIRNAVNLIGLNCCEYEMVIRYAEVMIRQMVNDNQIDSMFNIALTAFVGALIKTNESETLHGLFIWLKEKTNKRFAWITFAAEQANGHYEKAAEGYKNILNLTTESVNFDKNVREFVTEQVRICYSITRQWDQLQFFTEETRNAQQIEDIINFEKCHDASTIRLTNWEQFDENLDNVNNNFSYQNLLTLTENSLLNVSLTDLVMEKNLKQLENCKLIIQSGIQESFRTGTTEYLNNFIILNNIVARMLETTYRTQKMTKSNDFLALTKIKQWADYLDNSILMNKSKRFIDNYEDIHLNIISLARKNSNLKLCEIELNEYFLKRDIGKLFNGNLRKMSEYIQNNPNDIFAESDINGLCETSKWLLSQSNEQENGINLAVCCVLKILDDAKLNDLKRSNFSEKSAKILLNVSEWISQNPEMISDMKRETSLTKLISNLNEIITNSDSDIITVIPNTDMVVGKLIHLSVEQSPELSKAWSALGNWYYRWGRKVIEAKTDINAGLSDKDIESVKTLIPHAKEEDLREIVENLNNHQVIIDDEEIDTNERSSTDIIEQQLRTIDALQNVSSEIITAVVGIWRQAHKSKSLFYEKAADAYFKYLNLIPNNDDDNGTNYGECATITATLRLLRLMVKHAFGLQDVLDEGLSTTPTRPWKAIIPQLFSRLNHHEQYVRKRVSELLCRVANDSPHLIIFPAVVGAAQNDFSSGDDSKAAIAPLTLCFNSLLDTLHTQTPETVKQVQLLERELKRISILWDEFWLHALTQIYREYLDLFTSFENEARKCASEENIALLNAKHKILVAHVVSDLEKLHNYTNRPPETNNERHFQEKYMKLIQSTIDSLSNSTLNIEKPNESWQKIKQIYFIFTTKVQKNVQTMLKMSDISPILADLKNTCISMPGVETTESKPIFIRGVDNTVNILPTKTKPKKLAFYGSDGKKYTYLFKGLEDLHLDERIMQFLSISNSMMTKSNENYRAHHYSVIPLGPQSGLISWVDEMTPLFALYKKWQQREALNSQAKNDNKQFTVMRPSEMFYKKLIPLMEEQNLKTTVNRKSWPIEILRKVLTELTNETPKDLLAKELWCHSNNATDWRRSIRNYSRSVAVMSVIGYVIGLGDRHLDNILINLSTGNIVHIDYNVCFEKGKTLRVPERVPFRMTQNLEEALGITGMEGIFRKTCEHVLKTLRKEREILLTLLEAFVYDPLVDWAVNDDGTSPCYTNYTSITRTTKALMAANDINALNSTETENSALSTISDMKVQSSERRKPKKKLDLRHNVKDTLRDSLQNRFALIKPEWMQYKNDLTVQIKLISDSLNHFEQKRSEIEETESKRDFLSKQVAMVRELETLGTAMESHALNTVSQRYANYKKTLEEFNLIRGIFVNKLKNYENETNNYLNLSQMNFSDLLNDQLNLMLRRENEFQLCKGFLENSAQTILYMQAEKTWNNFGSALGPQINIMAMTIDSLEKYKNVIAFCPRSIIRKHRYFLYHHLGEILAENPSAYNQVTQRIYDNELEENLSNAEVNEQTLKYAYALEKTSLEIDFELKKSFDLIQSSNTEQQQNILDEAGEAILTFCSTTPSPKIILSAFLSNFNEMIKTLIEDDRVFIDLQLFDCSTHTIDALNKLMVLVNQFNQSSQIITTITKQNSWKHSNVLNSLLEFMQSLDKINMILRSNIVGEIIKIIMCEDSEMIEIAKMISQLQTNVDLNAILNNLGRNSNTEKSLNLLNGVFTKIRSHTKFHEIIDVLDQSYDQSYSCYTDALKYLNEYEETIAFKKVDHICLSKNIMESLEKKFLQEQFEIIKIITIMQTISTGCSLHKSLLSNDLGNLYDFNIFNLIISNSLNVIVRNFLCGFVAYVGSAFEAELLLSLGVETSAASTTISEDLLSNAVQQNIAGGFFSVSNYVRAQALCKNFLQQIEQNYQYENMNRMLLSQTNTRNHMQIICTVHFWMNEKKLVQQQQIFGHIFNKNVFIQNFQTALQNINTWSASAELINNELISIGIAISQRLKWAAGANQSLIGLQQSFDDLHSKNIQNNKKLIEIFEIISKSIATIMSYEMIKFNTQILDEEFLMLIKEFHKFYQANVISEDQLNPIEKGIVELLDPEGYIDQQWISNVCDLLDDLTDNVQNTVINLEKDISVVHDNLLDSAVKLKALFDNEILIDVRHLLKLTLKINHNHQAQQGQKLFLNNYREFINQISDLPIKILSKDFTHDNCRHIQKLIHTILIDINDINEELLVLMKDNSSDTPVRDRKKGNQPEQKRNAYAVSVWRRIKMKLEGRDPDQNRRQTVNEQVDWMIREATNPDNLAVLYEGWSPWV